MKKIQVIFCGGCNPHIERGMVLKRIKELSLEEGFIFTTEDGTDSSLVLIIDGCPTGCTLSEKSFGEKKVVRIAGETVNMVRTEESAIAAEAMKALTLCS